MLILARLSLKRDTGEEGRRQGRERVFRIWCARRGLCRACSSALRTRPGFDEAMDGGDASDLIFYTGCNILRTPHIALLCLDVLDALGLSYAVYGGPSNCCGILQFRPGDADNAGRQAFATIKRFAETGASEVVSWCPTCMIQVGETALPVYEEAEGAAGFDMSMMATFLARHLGGYEGYFRNRVEKRVGLHEHPGSPGVTEAVRNILKRYLGSNSST